MERLVSGMGKNSPKEYDEIFLKRKKVGVDSFDLNRWKQLIKFYKGGKLIDMGCLDSMIPEMALEKFSKAEVWGIDEAPETIKQMQKKVPKAIFKVEDVYNTHFPNNYFDYVVAGELIEHLDDPERFIKEAFRILKHGGTFALSTPKEEINEVGAVDEDRHLWSFTINDIKDMLGRYGDVKIKNLGSTYFPIYSYHFPTIIGYCFKK